MPKMAFVTVGTTSFDSLIETVSTDEFIEVRRRVQGVTSSTGGQRSEMISIELTASGGGEGGLLVPFSPRPVFIVIPHHLPFGALDLVIAGWGRRCLAGLGTESW